MPAPTYFPPKPIPRGKVVQGIPAVFGGAVDATPAQNYTDFWVLKRKAPGDPDTDQFAVSYGYLGYGDAPDNPVDIDGVPSDPTDDLTWNDWDGSDGSVWLECTDVDLTADGITSQVPDVAVQADAMGGSFTPSDQPLSGDDSCVDAETDGEYSWLQDQSTFKFLLAKLTADENGNLVIEMRVRGPLELKQGAILGTAVIYPGIREL
jgi:hypothetical protein